MSELINVSNRNSNFRSKLLISASSLALLAIVADPGSAAGADQDPSRPTVWIELGAQSEPVGSLPIRTFCLLNPVSLRMVSNRQPRSSTR